jgi:hypothetical protein
LGDIFSLFDLAVPWLRAQNFRSESSSQIREFGRHFFSHRSNLEEKKKSQMPIAKLKCLVANGDMVTGNFVPALAAFASLLFS